MTLFRRLSAALIATVFATALVASALSPARATVQTSANKTIVLGDGVTTQFNFSFIGVAAAYITVIYTDAGGNETVLTQGAGTTQYQITLNAPVTGAIWGVGGKVTYSPSGTPIANGTTLTIFRTLPLTQAISLQNKNSLAVLGNGSETGLDTGVMQSQQISENISRAFTAPIVDATAPLPVPPIAQRANKGAAFDGSGNLVAGTTPSSGIISSAMQPVVDAATLALGRTAFGLGNIAVENIGSGLQDDGSGNVRVNTSALTSVAVNQNVTSAFNNRSFVCTGPINFTLPQASTLWNGFSFTVYAFAGACQITPNGADNFPSLGGGVANTAPQNTVAIISTDGANSWYFNIVPRGVSEPQGYLSVCSATISRPGCTTGNLLPTTDAVGDGVLFYQTGPAGSHIPLYNGAIMMMMPFSELTLVLNSNHLASTIYDVCVFNNGGVPTIVTAPAWQTSTVGSGSRGAAAAIARTAGYWTNATNITGRNGASTYSIGTSACTMVGTIYIDSSAGLVSITPAYGQSRKWGVWNFYNRQPIVLQEGDPAASWNYTTNTWRQANAGGNTNNFIDVFSGLPEDRYDLEYIDTVNNTLGAGTTINVGVAIGFNSTSSPSGVSGNPELSNGTANNLVFGASPVAKYYPPITLGVNRVFPLENGKGSTAGTFFGTSSTMQLSAKWRG